MRMKKFITLIVLLMGMVGTASAVEISNISLKVKSGDNWLSYDFTKKDGYTFYIELSDQTSINILKAGTLEFKLDVGWTNWVGAFANYENVTTTKCVAKNEAYDSPTFKIAQSSKAQKLSIYVKWVEHETNNWQFYVTGLAIEDEYDVTFDKSTSTTWTDCYCYYASVNDHVFCPWPGKVMTLSSETIYKATIPSNTSLLVFSDNGSNKTSDFEVVKNGHYEYKAYENDNTKYNPQGVTTSITSVGYATFSSTKALDFNSEGTIEPCKASVNERGLITYTPVTSVAANEGVFLRRKDGTKTSASSVIPLHANQSVEANASNDFKAITSKTKLDQTAESKTNYILTNRKADGTPGPLGFYKVNTSGSWCAAGTAYLATSVTPAIARIYFPLEDETESVESIAAEQKSMDAPIYDLQGRCVTAPQKGLYIVNGKKIVINK